MERSTWDSAAKLTTASGTVLGEQAAHQVAIADVALDEDVAGLFARQGGQGVQIAGIGQLVQVDDLARPSPAAGSGQNWPR
jgi:hypothetical protein